MLPIAENVQLAIVGGIVTIVTTLLTLILAKMNEVHKAVNSRLDAMLERAAKLEDAVRDSGGNMPPRDVKPSTEEGKK